MIWGSFADFINMNGYGPYVWGSFGVTFALFVMEFIIQRREKTNVMLFEDKS